MHIRKNDIIIEYYKASGPGGQRRNKKETAVRIIHIPSGLSAISANERYQVLNKKIALERLREKIKSFYRKRKKRIITRKPAYVKAEILQVKKLRSKVKQIRRKIQHLDYE